MTEPARAVPTGGPVGETWLRFALLAVGAFASAVSVGVALWFAVFAERAGAALRRCAAVQDDPIVAATCDVADERHRVLFALAVGGGVILLAVLAWTGHTAARRRRLETFPVPSVLERTVVEPVLGPQGGRSRPALLWRSRSPIAMARADGIVRPYVEVGTNWAGLAVRDPATARAVVAHELHHVRSRDVVASGVAYWLGPVVGLLGAAYLVQLVILSDGAPVVEGVVRLAVIVLVVALGRSAVIRSREYEADLTAARAEPEGIRRLLRPQDPQVSSSRWWDLLRPHPEASARAAVVDRPWMNLRPGPTDGVIVGFAAAIAGQVFADLARSWFAGEAVLQGDVVGWGVAGALLGAWVTAMLVRSEAASGADGERPSRLVGFTALTALSSSVGMLLFRTGMGLPIRWPDRLGLGLAGAVALWLGLQALVSWIRAAAVRRGTSLARPRRGVGAVVLGGVLGGVALGNVGTIATYADLLDQAGDAVGVVDGLLLVLSVHAGSLSAVLLALLLAIGSLVAVTAARRHREVPPSRRTLVTGIVAGFAAAGAALGARLVVGADPTADPALAALLIQASVAAVLAAGAAAAAVRTPLGPQRACLSAVVGVLTVATVLAAVRADPAAGIVVLLNVAGPAVLLAAVLAGVMDAVGRRPAHDPVSPAGVGPVGGPGDSQPIVR